MISRKWGYREIRKKEAKGGGVLPGLAEGALTVPCLPRKREILMVISGKGRIILSG